MASASQNHPSFPPRNTYTSASKLPDRTGLNSNPPPFGSSSLARRPDQQNQPYSQPAPPQQHVQPGRQEKESNALNELSEEQREEINEAVCLRTHPLQDGANLCWPAHDADIFHVFL